MVTAAPRRIWVAAAAATHSTVANPRRDGGVTTSIAGPTTAFGTGPISSGRPNSRRFVCSRAVPLGSMTPAATETLASIAAPGTGSTPAVHRPASSSTASWNPLVPVMALPVRAVLIPSPVRVVARGWLDARRSCRPVVVIGSHTVIPVAWAPTTAPDETRRVTAGYPGLLHLVPVRSSYPVGPGPIDESTPRRTLPPNGRPTGLARPALARASCTRQVTVAVTPGSGYRSTALFGLSDPTAAKAAAVALDDC